MPLPPNASITDVINKLSELEGINQKTELASVIGSPALSTDTVAQQIVKLQNSKDLLANTLTNQGVPAINSEPINDMVVKVDELTKIKSASGTATSNNAAGNFLYRDASAAGSFYPLVVSGLSFKPKRIRIVKNESPLSDRVTEYYEDFFGFTEYVISANLNTGSTGGASSTLIGNSGSAYVNATGFSLPVRVNNVAYRWIAYDTL